MTDLNNFFSGLRFYPESYHYGKNVVEGYRRPQIACKRFHASAGQTFFFFLGYTWQIRTLFKEEIVNTFTNAREERLS